MAMQVCMGITNYKVDVTSDMHGRRYQFRDLSFITYYYNTRIQNGLDHHKA